MPELPETETIARDLDREITGAHVTSVHVVKSDVLRGIDALTLGRRVTGTSIERCWRRAKLIVIDLSSGDRLVVQPRFTGALLIDDGSLPARERQYATIEFSVDEGRTLLYRDIRRLGTVALMDGEEFERYVSRLGIEPLDPKFTAAHLSALLRGARRTVKQVLMDQRVVAGIGNIYANEALWRAGIDPSRTACALSANETAALRDSIVGVLTASIAARGTSFRDYRDARGGRGRFVEQLAVYGRGGEACLRCGHRLIETHAIDGRTTVLCANCQE